MIISGKNSIEEAFVAKKTINRVYINNKIHDDFCERIVKYCKQNGIRYDFVDKKILDKFSLHNQGYVAEITDYEYSSLDEILNSKKEKGSFIILLDGVEDPHNLGSITRVADCVGVDGIVIENRHCCNVNETVYKTSCGAINHVKIAKVTNLNDTIKYLKKNGVWVFACDMDGADVFSSDLTGNVAIVLGGEGQGVSMLTKKLCDGVVSLPMFGKVNSLNVSTACSAIVYEIVRQRQKNG